MAVIIDEGWASSAVAARTPGGGDLGDLEEHSRAAH